jgi:hypothetical protein
LLVPHIPAVHVRVLHSVSTPGHWLASVHGGIPLELAVLELVVVLLLVDVLELVVLLLVVLELVELLVLELVLAPELDEEPLPPAPPEPTRSGP